MRRCKGRDGDAERQDSEHLEELAHGLRSSQPFDRCGDCLSCRFIGAGAEPAGTFEETHAQQEVALC